MNQYQLYQQAKAELAASRKADEPVKIELEEVHRVVAGALYDFGAYLSIQSKDVVVGMFQDSTPLLQLLADFCTNRSLETENARILFWQDIIKK